MMFSPDIINGLFEFGGAAAILLSVRRVLQDKDVKGVSWWMIIFFAAWGFWNLFYYPHLDQWWSFLGGIALVLTNSIYLALLIFYSVEWSPGQDVLDRGYWKETYTGAKFFLMDPRADEIVFEDVAHSLAYQCRYTGHCLEWYSVAEHCCLLSDYVRNKLKLGPHAQYFMLMHDSSEAYTGDISRPMKYGIPGLKASIAHIERIVLEAFEVPYPEPRWLKELDARMIVDERAQNMVDSGNDWNHDKFEALGIKLKFWEPVKAKAEFIKRYRRLLKEMAAVDKENAYDQAA